MILKSQLERYVRRGRAMAAVLGTASAFLVGVARADAPPPSPPCTDLDAGDACVLYNERGICMPVNGADKRYRDRCARRRDDSNECLVCVLPPDPILYGPSASTEPGESAGPARAPTQDLAPRAESGPATAPVSNPARREPTTGIEARSYRQPLLVAMSILGLAALASVVRRFVRRT
jgi:hypothetical protein